MASGDGHRGSNDESLASLRDRMFEFDAFEDRELRDDLHAAYAPYAAKGPGDCLINILYRANAIRRNGVEASHGYE
jgi:hypothetical protein